MFCKSKKTGKWFLSHCWHWKHKAGYDQNCEIKVKKEKKKRIYHIGIVAAVIKNKKELR